MKDASPAPFMERLQSAVASKGAPVVVGLDPRPEWFPADVWPEGGPSSGDGREAAAEAIVRFNELILDAVRDAAVAVKPQLAFYERWGWPGVRAVERTMRMARERGLLVIADGKRNDIGSTAAAYARAYLGRGTEGGEGPPSGLEADALTVNPYLGVDGLAPFVDACRAEGKAIFVLVRTSNPSGDDVQGLGTGPVDGHPAAPQGNVTVADRVADMIAELNEGLPRAGGFGPVGAVVGATRPAEARALRARLPGVMFLVPGFGAQGAGAEEARAAFDARGRGALVNSARGILYAWRRKRPETAGTGADYAAAARDAAFAMGAALRAALGRGVGVRPEEGAPGT